MNESGVLSGIETKFSTPPTTNFSHGHMNTSGVLGGVGKSLATPPGTNLLTGHMNISGGGGIVSGAESNFVTPLVKNLLNLTLGFLDEEEEDGFRGTGRGGGGGGEFDSYWDENLNSSSSSSSFFPSSSSSSSANESEYVWDEDDLLYRHSLQIAALLCLSYIIVFILGLVGNCFVIAVVFRTPRMRTPTNYFIVNLAMADVLVVVFCLPATLLSNIYYPWMLGWLMCKSVAYVQGVSVSASVNSLVAVSLDRFLAIWFPMKLQITTYRARAIIVLIWIMAVVSPIPYFVYFETNVFIPELPDLLVCVEMWPSREAEWLYFLIAHLLLCYLLPLVLISFCYIMIWIKVARRDIPGDTRDAAIQQMQQRSKVKVVKMLVVVVIIFMLSWLPLYVIFARIKLGEELGEREGAILAIVTPMAQWLGSSNSCINPILYAFFNKKYRNGFLAIIKSRSCCGTLRFDSYSYSTTRRSYYPSYRSTIRPEAGTMDSISRHKNTASNVYTLEGRAQPRTRYHHHHVPARPRLANGLAPALHLADNFTTNTDLDQKCSGGAASSTLLAGIEVVDVDTQEMCFEEGEQVYPNGKLDVVD